MAAKKKARRTTHRTSKGTKLYAKRDAKGRITDIQTYKRAHAADLRKKGSKSDAPRKKKAVAKTSRTLVKAKTSKAKVPTVAKRRVAAGKKQASTTRTAAARRVAAVRAAVRKAPTRTRAAV